MNKVSLNGVEIYPFDSEQSLLSFVNDNKGILVAINAEKILHATDQTRGIINRNIGYCDGAGAQMALKQKGFENACKIPGCELWLKIVAQFYREKTFYLIGGKPQIIEETVSKLRKEYAGIHIIGYRDGYIKANEERERLIKDITEKRPDVVFVAMGSPKQELLMEEIQHRHKAIFQGLGGSFDVYTGHVERAPKWWVNHNLEFAYRLLKEPKRKGVRPRFCRLLFESGTLEISEQFGHGAFDRWHPAQRSDGCHVDQLPAPDRRVSVDLQHQLPYGNGLRHGHSAGHLPARLSLQSLQTEPQPAP